MLAPRRRGQHDEGVSPRPVARRGAIIIIVALGFAFPFLPEGIRIALANFLLAM